MLLGAIFLRQLNEELRHIHFCQSQSPCAVSRDRQGMRTEYSVLGGFRQAGFHFLGHKLRSMPEEKSVQFGNLNVPRSPGASKFLLALVSALC